MDQNKQKTYAEDAYQKGDYQTAKKLYEGVLEKTNDPFVYLRVAQCLLALGEYSEAQTICQKGLGFNPDSVELHILLGKIFYKLNNLPQAEEEAMVAINLDESRAEGAYTILSIVRFLQEKYPEAIQNAEIAVKMNPNAWDAHYVLGMALGIAQIDHHRALKELWKTYKLNPSTKHGFALLFQFVVAHKILVNILLLAVIVSALVTGNLTLVILVSVVYLTLGVLGFLARKTTAAILLIGIGLAFLGLYFLFW